jgi:multidrug efflux pump subunit AcrA (membrane-fusion protein)
VAPAAEKERSPTALKPILTPGLFCRVRVPVGDEYRAVLVPDAALQTDQGRKFLYVVTPKMEEGKPVYKKDAEGKPVYEKKKNAKGEEEVVKDKDGNPMPVPVYQVEYRNVETGMQLGEYRVIKKGLANEKGELIVTKGQQRVRLNAQDKQEVEIKWDDMVYKRPASPVASKQ